MTKVHIVNHTHWDREWYFTSMDALSLSDGLFTDVIDELLSHPEASFVLDGQISILDDYLELYPERKKDVKELVERKQLYIGPWYTQTDCAMVSGEAILRNGMIGCFESKKYGIPMDIGYLPDTFGFNAQIPLILNELGIHKFIFWRGINFDKHVNTPYFIWKGLNGCSKVTAVNFPQGYGTGMLLEPNLDYVNGRLDKGVDFIRSIADEEDIIIPSGNDQLNIITDFHEKVEKINEIGKYDYVPSSYEEFFKIIQKKNLPLYQGELYDPKYARVHKTISSVRLDQKQKIFHLEQKLIKRLEPLMVIANSLNISISNRLLFKAWKKLFECQAHDSMAGCVSDSVAIDISHRLKEANEICDDIENLIVKRIAESLQLEMNQVIIFNTDVKQFEGYKVIDVVSPFENIEFPGITCEILERKKFESRENILEETSAGNRYITEPSYYLLKVLVYCQLPGMGYKVLSFEKSKMEDVQECTDNTISTGKYSVRYENDKIKIYSKDCFVGYIDIEDEKNCGDTYDFSPSEGDTKTFVQWNECKTRKGLLTQSLVVDGIIQIDHVNMNVNLVASLCEKDLSLSLSFENTALNHRLRLCVVTKDMIQKARAAIPFGFLDRTNRCLDDWKKEYSEKPVNIERFEQVVSAYVNDKVYSVFTQDTKEYEYEANRLKLTVLSTTDSLGKPNLINRPGRASGDTTKKGHVMMDTPLALSLNKKINFKCKLRIDDAIDDKALTLWQDRNNLPDISYQKQELNYFIYRIDNKIQSTRKKCAANTEEYTLLTVLDENIECSAIHASYYDLDSFVIRFKNSTSNVQYIDPKMFSNFNIKRIDALETEKIMDWCIAPYGVATYKLQLRRK